MYEIAAGAVDVMVVEACVGSVARARGSVRDKTRARLATLESAPAKMPGGMAHCWRRGAVGDRRGAAISRRAESVARANST